jgi:hypothetical protein
LFNAKLSNGQYVIPKPQTIVTDPNTGLPEGFSAFSSACPYHEDQFMTNMDWLQNAKSSFQARFFFSNSEGTFTMPAFVGATLPGSPVTNPQNFRNFSLTHTYLFSTQLVNQAEIGFHRTLAGTQPHLPVTYSELGSTVAPFEDAATSIVVLGDSTSAITPKPLL